MQPTSEELKEFVLWAQKFQPDALKKIKRNNFIFDNLEDPWQKLAFTLYTNLCEIESKSRQLFEDVE